MDKANFSTIANLLDDSLKLLWPSLPSTVCKSQVRIFVTDGAPYMVKAATFLKAFYPKMIHVTCLVHGLHRIAEKLQTTFLKVDQLVSCMKKKFLKSPVRVAVSLKVHLEKTTH